MAYATAPENRLQCLMKARRLTPMTLHTSPTLPTPRSLVCESCGAAFSCGLSAECWCAAETARLPLPEGTGDCLCPACMRRAAAEPGMAS